MPISSKVSERTRGYKEFVVVGRGVAVVDGEVVSSDGADVDGNDDEMLWIHGQSIVVLTSSLQIESNMV